MYVCLCRGITDTQIRQAVQAGKGELRQLKQELGLGSQCGKCLPMAKAIIKAELDKAPRYYEVA
ncbi:MULTISPECIES: bacterioferritin-associated ferredoxin [Aeromonas]|uniref:Bacterioferritin-associated ferredoxin n=1 Tax=Aeromonas bivalvium TaxID=440079 RepID=A0ABW9GRU1_9GAMM|nr:bacterioferritin-associated ferredoxin [Aeromonas bivalvium]